MSLNIMSIEKIKPVYSNEMQTIFVCTNRDVEMREEINENAPSKYLYSNGEFFNITGASPTICTRAQHNFLLGLMTQFGTF